MAISGRATSEGTARLRLRHPGLPREHWRKALGVEIGSIGFGTYLGEADEESDRAYTEAALVFGRMGGNLVDTAINYRFQRSERAIGRALAEGTVARDEILLCTKGGFLPFDGGPPADAGRWIAETFRGVISPADLVLGCHCMSPRYLRHQIDQSLRNLGVETIDVYYLHNPETQLDAIDREEFYRRLVSAFEALEEAVERGKICWYGTATWDAYRVDPAAHDYLSLESVLEAARSAAGERHHFRVVQLPFNMGMTEALQLRNQEVAGRALNVLAASTALDLTVFASVPLLQGRLAGSLPERLRSAFPGLSTDAQRAIQFVRSTPGILAPLVGSRSVAHVEENLSVAGLPPLAQTDYEAVFH